MPEYIVLATNTNHDNVAYGPFSSYEDAQAAKFSQGGKDKAHEHQVLQLFDNEKPLPVTTQPLYERDMEKRVLHDLAVEALEDEPPFEPAEQEDAEEEDEPQTENVDLTSAPVESEGNEEEDERTLKELRSAASERDIPGRSGMDREQLEAALAKEE